MFNRNDNKRHFRKFRFFPLLIIGAILLGGLVVMLLWNAILPTALHAGTLNYGQSIGLLVLCRLLVGSGGRRFGPRGPGRGMPGREKWMSMSAEDKEKFREEWKKRCGKRPE